MNSDPAQPANFPKEARLLSSPEFRRVFDRKSSASDDTLIVYAAKSDNAHTRLGLAVSKKIGNAVVRNAWKRRIREAFRRQRVELPVGFDFVVLPRRGASASASKIHASLPTLCRRSAKRCERSQDGQKKSPRPRKRQFGRGKGKSQ